jgi:hypothetical protein
MQNAHCARCSHPLLSIRYVSDPALRAPCTRLSSLRFLNNLTTKKAAKAAFEWNYPKITLPYTGIIRIRFKGFPSAVRHFWAISSSGFSFACAAYLQYASALTFAFLELAAKLSPLLIATQVSVLANSPSDSYVQLSVKSNNYAAKSQ